MSRTSSIDAFLARLDGAEAMLRAAATQVLSPKAMVRLEQRSDELAQQLLLDAIPPSDAPSSSSGASQIEDLASSAMATLAEPAGAESEDVEPSAQDDHDPSEHSDHSYGDEWGDDESWISFVPPEPEAEEEPPEEEDDDDVPDYLQPRTVVEDAPPSSLEDDTDETDETDETSYLSFIPEEPEDGAEPDAADQDDEGDDQEEEDDGEWATYPEPVAPEPYVSQYGQQVEEIAAAVADEVASAQPPEPDLPGLDPEAEADLPADEPESDLPGLDPEAEADLPGVDPEPLFGDDDDEEQTAVFHRSGNDLSSLRRTTAATADLSSLRSGPAIPMGRPSPSLNDDFDDEEDFDDEHTQVLRRPQRDVGGPAAIRLGGAAPKPLQAQEEEHIALGDTADYGGEEPEEHGGLGGLGVVEYETEPEELEEIEDIEDIEPEPLPGAAHLSEEEIQAVIQAAEQAARKDIKRGVVLWGDVIDADPGRVSSYLTRGRYFTDLGDYVGAASDLQRAEVLEPRNPEIQLALGELFFQRKDYAKTVIYLDRALQLRPDFPQALARRGMTFYFRRQYRRAIDDLSAAMKLDPEIPHIEMYLKRARKQVK